MKKLEFRPQDFLTCEAWAFGAKQISDIANARIAEMLKDAKVFYGYKIDSGELTFHEWKPVDCTHQALVFNVEELPKPECKHEPSGKLQQFGELDFRDACKHCGVPLEAIGWKEAKR